MKKTIGIKLAVTAGCLSMMAAAPAAYSAEIVTAENPEIILNTAKGYGSAKLKKDSDGDPFIIGRIDGNKYGIFFYGCTDGKECDDIQFKAIWGAENVTMDDVNGWNAKKKFGTAYIDSDGDVSLKMSVNIDYGVTEENLDDSFNWWNIALKGFRKDVLKR